MRAWKPWQIVLLVYLLTLNLAVFGLLAFYLLTNLFWSRPAVSATVAASLVDTPRTTIQLTLSPGTARVEDAVPSLSTKETMREDRKPPDYIPSVNIPPATPPGRAEITTSNPEQIDTPIPSPANPDTRQPGSTSTLAALPATETGPTAILTKSSPPTPTSTSPPATHTVTSTPLPVATSTATATRTPQPTTTPTQTSSPTSSPSATPTSTPTLISPSTAAAGRTPTSPKANISTTALAATNRPIGQATVEEVVSGVTSILSGVEAKPELDQPGQTVASEPGFMDALPLTNGSIALSWSLVEKTPQYHIYSDMGSGYGVFVYKAHTGQPIFIDEQLRSGMAYRYRLTRWAANQEVVLAQVTANTFADEAIVDRGSGGQPEISAASVMAAPTALPTDAILLGLVSDNNFTDNFNTLTIVGELRNDSNVDVGQTDITVTFYDSAGTVIGMANGETLLETISPSEKSPFLLALTRPSGFASYSIRAIGRPVPLPKQTAQLSVVEVRRYEDEAGFFHIKGLIQNVGSTMAKRTKVAAIIYGRDRGVINVGFTYVDPPTLYPGEKAAYEVIFAYYPRYLTQQVIPFEE